MANCKEKINKDKAPRGRPPKPIDWDFVDELLLAGCHCSEIAPHFNLSADHFGIRVAEEKNMLFTEYAGIIFDKGNSLLRDAQYKKATNGDNTMLVWLGKNRLKQRDAPIDMQVTQAHVEINESVMAQLSKNQQIAKEALEQSKEEMTVADDHIESHSDI